MEGNISADKELWIDIVKWTACMLVLLGVPYAALFL